MTRFNGTIIQPCPYCGSTKLDEVDPTSLFCGKCGRSANDCEALPPGVKEGQFLEEAMRKAEAEKEKAVPVLYNHMLDLAFTIETEADDEALFKQENLASLISRARARIDEIEREGSVEAFGLCDSYEVTHFLVTAKDREGEE